jgi:hypothetical protein
MEAITYARKHLATFADTNMKEIQTAMATLAFKKETTCDKYKDLFAPEKWDDLITNFRLDNYQVYGLPTQSVLTRNLEVGLSSLKTWYIMSNFTVTKRLGTVMNPATLHPIVQFALLPLESWRTICLMLITHIQCWCVGFRERL